MEEYYKHIYNKQNHQRNLIDQKLSSQSNVSLNMHSEERLQQMKEHMNKLTDKVDQNMNNYMKYTYGKEQTPVMQEPYNNPSRNNDNTEVLSDYYNSLGPSHNANTQELQKINDTFLNTNAYNGNNPNQYNREYNGSEQNDVPKIHYGNNVVRSDVTSRDLLDRIYDKNYNSYKQVLRYISRFRSKKKY